MNKKEQIKFNKLLDLYKDKLNQFIINNKLDDSPEYVLNCILSADPDIIGKNSKWLINNTLNGNILWEDIESGEESKSYDTLNRFLNIRNQFTDPKLRDINQFHRLGDIAQQLRGYEVIQSNKSIKNEEKQQIYNETEFLYNENGYLVISPKTKKSSCFWGLGTEWCTASTRSENYFNDYNDYSPLYICILSNGRKYQFHRDSEPMDENDNPIDNITDPILRQLAIFTGKAHSVKIINYNDENEARVACSDKGYYNQDSLIKNMDKKLPFYKDCCFLAVQNNGWAIEYIDKNLPNYKQLCVISIKKNPESILLIDKELPNYKYLCKLAIKLHPEILINIDKNLPYHKELCEFACNNDYNNLFYIDKTLPYYNELCEYTVKKEIKALELIDKDLNLPNYKELYDIAYNNFLLKIKSKYQIQEDKDLYLFACKENPFFIEFIDKSSPYYEDCCKMAVQQDGDTIQYIDSNLPYYEKLCEIAIQENGWSIRFIASDLPYHKKLCFMSIEKSGNVIVSINPLLPYYEDCCKIAAQQYEVQQDEEKEKPNKEEIKRDFSEIKEILMNTKIPIIKKDKELINNNI